MKRIFKSSLMIFTVLLFCGSALGTTEFGLMEDDHEQTPIAEKILVNIISEPEDDKIHQMFLDLDESGDILKIIRRSNTDQTVFSPDDLLKGEVVLARAADRDAVLISCRNCGPAHGGTLILKYLNNGMTNAFKTFEMDLERDGNDWMLTTEVQGKRVKIETLRLKSRKFGSILIGIKDIEVNR